jgi:hypothetical protein
MSNEIIKQESAVNIFNVDARSFGVVANTETGRILNQTIGATRYYKEGKHNYRISVDLRFDDQCRNGHESFSITADIREEISNGRYREYMGGCCHDEIAKHFPELSHLIKWHLTSTDGPMHYIANVTYHAGNRDCNGRAAGEPSQFSHAIRFGKVPALHFPNDGFFKFLRANIGRAKEFQMQEIKHKKDPGGYDFSPKYSISGFCTEWYQCPFDSKEEAAAFIASLKKCEVEFLDIPTAFSKGKERQLDFARSGAVWPEATDEELSVSKAELTAALIARLPAFSLDFEKAMRECGFVYPEKREEAAK